MIEHIEKLKTEVRKEKSLSHKSLIDLHSQLLKYKNDLLNTDSSLRMEFENVIMITERSFDTIKTDPNDFPRIFFKHTSAEAKLATLTKFQNNIKINENQMIRFCDLKVTGIIIDYYGTYSAMVNQSSNYVKSGDQIEISAGVGTFSLKAKPLITINGKNVSPETDGVAYYAFKVSEKPGKHYIPVKIMFIDQDGKKQTISKLVMYTVRE
jgi:hypothetical protein